MKDNNRTRLVVLAHVALVALSVLFVRLGREAFPFAHAGKAAARGAAAPPAQAPAQDDGKIQIALLLDTSSSMSGLIDQARSQLWKIVTRLDGARRAGKRPRLEIALYEYGNSGRGQPERGWIRQVMPLSGDLDRVSEALFALDTNGGEEFAGQAIRTAATELGWSGRPGDLRLMFVAGNEEFTQGPVSPEVAMAGARNRGIRVNVIHCGGEDATWKQGARLAGTPFLMIDQNQVVAHVAAPQDDEIARLGVELNATYIAYGAEGNLGFERQKLQDSNAATAQAGSVVWRSLAKSSASYRNAGWDLADAVTDGKVALDRVAADDLPEAMRSMTVEQRRAYVQQKLAERGRLQKRIRELSAARDAFVAAARQKQAGQGAAASLDAVMLATAEAQAKAAGFRLE
jgi:hypothetical protein